MEITNTVYVDNRKDWRRWLKNNHKKDKEIWLVYYKKHTGISSIPYNDAVEEALCFGWIDSTVKSGNSELYYQRFSPRRKGSPMSELNKERVRMLIKQNKMTSAGMAHFKDKIIPDKLKIPAKILKELKKDKTTWKNFSNFPEHYKRIRIGWIAMTKRPKTFRQRLEYFLKMTRQNKKFGMLK